MATAVNLNTPYNLPKKNLHELHWRAEPPEWGGHIDIAYDHLYSSLRVSVSTPQLVVLFSHTGVEFAFANDATFALYIM